MLRFSTRECYVTVLHAMCDYSLHSASVEFVRLTWRDDASAGSCPSERLGCNEQHRRNGVRLGGNQRATDSSGKLLSSCLRVAVAAHWEVTTGS